MPDRRPSHRPLDRRRAVAGTLVTALAFALALLDGGALPPLAAGGFAVTVRVGIDACRAPADAR
ncbi:MAG TPA: hypothetical protein VFY16_09570 [Gemmatimonadaceae bacterium]|nr:hypothetical protein [Gemmatimonadaceae bacterium]